MRIPSAPDGLRHWHGSTEDHADGSAVARMRPLNDDGTPNGEFGPGEWAVLLHAGPNNPGACNSGVAKGDDELKDYDSKNEPITFAGMVNAKSSKTATSEYVPELFDDNNQIEFGHVKPSGDVSFALQKYDVPNSGGKCGVQIETMTLAVEIKLAEGATASNGRPLTLNQPKKDLIIKHERVHRDKLQQHFSDFIEIVKTLDAGVQMLPAGAAQIATADAMVAKYTPKMQSYLNRVEGVEKIRQSYHLDQLDENTWTIVNNVNITRTGRTNRGKVTPAELKAAFAFLNPEVPLLATATTVGQVDALVLAYIAAVKTKLKNEVNADIAAF